ncbi:MAG: sugar phosphate isomerase/epimerase [Phycisphaerales bacterium]|nr:MAG: sugar phosphate isomerase/epimerase [Phycisphaerales bacterium]
MKIGFSSLVCPEWDLEQVIATAASSGFDGVELHGVGGETPPPAASGLARDPEEARRKLVDSKVELICLSSPASLTSHSRSEVAATGAAIAEVVELASELSCPFVRIGAGDVDRWDYDRAALSRVAYALRDLAPLASEKDVTLLVENGGDFPGSGDVWFAVDGADHPAVKACWNQRNAMIIGERPTRSLHRLGSKIGLVHLCDARFDRQGELYEYTPLGQGDGDIARQVDLLKGLTYGGYLVYEWPKAWARALPGPETALADAAKFMRECIEAEQTVLTAYKGDKNPPRIVSRCPVTSEP